MTSGFSINRRHALAGGAALGALTGAVSADAQGAAVRVSEGADAFTLDNGIVRARVSKRSGDIISLEYKGLEMLSAESGHPFGYWSHDTSGGIDTVTAITINPAANGGERAEVSVKGVSGGRVKMGHGPGAPADGDIYADVEIRYHLGRGEQGVHTYCIFDHPAAYPGATMAEARFAAKAAGFFTHIHIDDMRSGRYPLVNEGIDKYVYTSLQAENRAYGWTSPERRRGLWFLITSPEYLSGGPTKPEFLAHGTHPTILSYWKSSHYMGSNVTMFEGEDWSRVVGPFMLYVNEGATPEGMWDDAKAKLAMEESAWPYAWVDHPAFASPAQRARVGGRLVLDDPLAPPGADRFRGRLSVGLSKAPYDIPDGNGGTRTIIWQNEGKHCQYWAHNTDGTGRFSIPNVPPGTWNLHAYADGVLGEFLHASVEVPPGGDIDLGDLNWTPVRHGRQIFEVGTPTRSAFEFSYARRYFEPGVPLRYPELFPSDVTFTPGVSEPSRDWFYMHVPHCDNDEAEVVEFRGVQGTGRASPYRIRFAMDGAGAGKGVLRLAVCGTGPQAKLGLSVNGRDVGDVPLGRDDGTFTRHQIMGRWYETELEFDGRLLKAGENEVVLTVPAGGLNSGVIYDYVRLELDESAA